MEGITCQNYSIVLDISITHNLPYPIFGVLSLLRDSFM